MATTMTLSQLMVAVRQRADMYPSGYTPSTTSQAYFVSDPELISYINQSYFEFYDLLITAFEDYFLASPLVIPTDGTTTQYPVPDGVLYSAAPQFYKLMGVDVGIAGNSNAWVTVQKFDFISRNRYVYPQLTSTYLGVFNMRYRLLGQTIMFIPTPSAAQFLRFWYIPALVQLANLSDTMDGVSGWTELVICDAAIKCMQKEESDVSVLMAQKMALITRIENTSMNRDAGQPDTVSDVRRSSERWGGMGPNGDGPMGGF